MADRPTGSAAKRLSFVVLTVLLCIAAAEVFAYVGYHIVRDNVELWPAWRDRVRDRGYQTFLENRYDPLTGWNNPRNEVKKRQNCLNEDWVHIYDGKGARVHSSDEDKPVRVVIVGDSYAAGSEVNGDETFPALLERRLGVRIAYHGVGGIGPTCSGPPLSRDRPG